MSRYHIRYLISILIQYCFIIYSINIGLTALVPTASTAIEVDSLPVCPIHPVLITPTEVEFTGINN